MNIILSSTAPLYANISFTKAITNNRIIVESNDTQRGLYSDIHVWLQSELQ
jgi:hypothetical protein